MVFPVLFAAAASAAVPSLKSLKVLMIGNSFSICALDEMPSVAQAMGLELELGSLYIGGCSLERHWKNVQASANPTNRPYRYDLSVNGKRLKKEMRNIPEALSAAKWDVVTVQQASHFSWKPETYEPFFANLLAEIRKRAPQAEVVWQETWSYTPWDLRLKSWGFDPDAMYAKLHAAYCGIARRYGQRVIPMGTAVQLYRARLPVAYTANSLGGDVCGKIDFSQQADGTWKAKGDMSHLNRAGNYLQGLVWTATLFNVDVTTCPYVSKHVSPQQADCMKACAMAAVRGELPKGLNP